MGASASFPRAGVHEFCALIPFADPSKVPKKSVNHFY